MSQTHANRPAHKEDKQETDVGIPKVSEEEQARRDKRDADLDELMDEIDDVLADGTSVETSVQFLQKGGQ